MKKLKVLYITMIFLSLVILFKNDYIFADESNINDTIIDETKDDEKESQRKEIINMINECIKDMKTELREIEAKEEKVKKQKEFENYPAIRLNVDTPFFRIYING